MARQVGLIRLDGTIGDITFYRTKDGYRARQKTSLNAERIASDPHFARSRENSAEFGNACKAGALLRKSFHTLMMDAKDGTLVSRLVKELIALVKTDTTNRRGNRTISAGDLSLLVGFQFNQRAILKTMLFTPYTCTIDRTTGTATLTIAPFIPENALVPPQGATHFSFVCALAAIHFDKQTYTSKASLSETYPLKQPLANAIQLTPAVDADSPLPLFMAIGICFHEEVNNSLYPLKNGGFNPLSIAAINTL